MHSWFKYCTDPAAFAKVTTLRKFIETMRKQANTDIALVPYRETVRLEDYDDIEFTGALKAPRYFGAGVEALAETFFEVFGSEYNVQGYSSQDSVEVDVEDTGYDAVAYTSKQKNYGKQIRKICQPGNHVYIQVKGTLNPTKEFMTNDGSRIMNFYANAQGRSRMMGEAYKARFMLFTTGKGLHYKLEANTFDEIEVINFSMIDKKINGDPFFWNAFFVKMGLPAIPIEFVKDPEYLSLEAELELTIDN